MELTIDNKENINKFSYFIKNLKNISGNINISFNENCIYSKGLNENHTSLYEFKISNEWFCNYNYTSSNDTIDIGLNTIILFKIFNTLQENENIKIIFNEENDVKLFIEFVDNITENKKKSKNFNKYFEIPLFDTDIDNGKISENEWEVEFNIISKKLLNICNQINTFDDKLNILCNENEINFYAEGICGKINATLDIDDVDEYSIIEDLELNNCYAECAFNFISNFYKLSNNIILKFSINGPMIIYYKINNSENNHDKDHDNNQEAKESEEDEEHEDAEEDEDEEDEDENDDDDDEEDENDD